MKNALILSGGGARGAFEVGVMKYLDEMNWKPDLICGTSVGAINAAAYGSGLPIDRLIEIWKKYRRQTMYRISLPILFQFIKSKKQFSPMSDTSLLKKLLTENIDIKALRKSETDILITATNMITGQVKFFNQEVITIDHIMAASAIPGLFPWHYIDNEPYWDAGLMANTPIAPALEKEAAEIIVVLLSPVGAFNRQVPRSPMEVAELVFEQFLVGSYTMTLPNSSWQVNPDASVYQTPLSGSPQLSLSKKNTRIMTVAPTRTLGFRSLLNFSVKQANTLMNEGYNNARIQLKSFIRSS